MNATITAPWHTQTYERFLQETLPELLAARLPLTGYRAVRAADGSAAVAVAVSSAGAEVCVEYAGLPGVDAEGLIHLAGRQFVVVPQASDDDLETAEIRCVGEQLLDYVADRLSPAAAELPWDEHLLRGWLPLDTWFAAFLAESPTVQTLDDRNWLARQAHLRRLLLPGNDRRFLPGHLGRVCPFETPDGPNLGAVGHLAQGATIRDRRLIVENHAADQALGLTAAMVPCLEHDDPVRLTFGVNMMRQWLPPERREPACVQTGNEPDLPGFWCGCNLLTAFMSLGAETFEDALVVSESCAAGFGGLTAGDKLSNRHGAKGTISAIRPDEEMPRLPDGTPVDLVMSFLGLHTRLNFGQVREAVLGRLARTTGREAIAAPFVAPSDEELRRRLSEAGLPPDGREHLRLAGEVLPEATAVGWVYWGLTYHRAAEKLHAAGLTGERQRQGELEYYALRDAGAYANVIDTFGTRALEGEQTEAVAERITRGWPCEPAPPPAPQFERLAARLAAAGIGMRLREETLQFGFEPVQPPALSLAEPIGHPWIADRELTALGLPEDLPEPIALQEANARLASLLQTNAPASLLAPARERLGEAARAYVEGLVQPADLRPTARVACSGRAVLSPATGLTIEQVGLPEELAWTIFGPLVAARLGDEAAVQQRTPAARACLDELLAGAWVLVNRAPSVMPTSLLAFRPVRHPDPVLRLHPLACALLNADFDGDQAAVLLPLSAEAQAEAGERLSVAGHLQRDPALLRWLTPPQEMIWGLARLSLTVEGREQVEQALGRPLGSEALLTRAELRGRLEELPAEQGGPAVLEAVQRLMAAGFEAAVCGASLHPFIGTVLERPLQSEGAVTCAEEMSEWLASLTEYASPVIGPQLLAVKSGARGSISSLQRLCGPVGAAPGRKDYATSLRDLPVPATRNLPPDRAPADQRPEAVTIAGGMAGGLSPAELFAHAADDRDGLARSAEECTRLGYMLREASLPEDFSVLSRAMRSQAPGRVFARAAAAQEVDPLRTVDGRLFVGLPPR